MEAHSTNVNQAHERYILPPIVIVLLTDLSQKSNNTHSFSTGISVNEGDVDHNHGNTQWYSLHTFPPGQLTIEYTNNQNQIGTLWFTRELQQLSSPDSKLIQIGSAIKRKC